MESNNPLNIISSDKSGANQFLPLVSALDVLKDLSTSEGEQFWEMLGGIFDGLNQGIIVSDRSGRAVVFNRMAESIMGFSRSEVVGRKSLWDFCEECNRPPIFLENFSQGLAFSEEEVEMSGAKGKVGVRVTALYSQAGGLLGALATIRSLDEAREKEKEQRKLERQASLGRIVSAVAHEINNPLQTVRTSLELALNPHKTQKRRLEYLQGAEKEILRIASIIGQMQNFYRPRAGKYFPSALNEKLKTSVQLLEKTLMDAGVEIDMKLQENLPPVNLIGYQLEQVILNLLLNAIEAMPEGGKLLISTWLVDHQRIALSFMDHNSSLKQDQLNRLLEPLEHRQNGFIIGMSVTREIIEELGGTLEISSNEHTTLTLYLPI